MRTVYWIKFEKRNNHLLHGWLRSMGEVNQDGEWNYSYVQVGSRHGFIFREKSDETWLLLNFQDMIDSTSKADFP